MKQYLRQKNEIKRIDSIENNENIQKNVESEADANAQTDSVAETPLDNESKPAEQQLTQDITLKEAEIQNDDVLRSDLALKSFLKYVCILRK